MFAFKYSSINQRHPEQPVESLSDDFLFPMQTSRLSYASSPESDLEMSPGPSASLSLGNLPTLVKSSSDPSIATNQDNLERDHDLNLGEGMPPPYTVSSYNYYFKTFFWQDIILYSISLITLPLICVEQQLTTNMVSQTNLQNRLEWKMCLHRPDHHQ